MKIRLRNEHEVIQVQLWTNGDWKHNICGRIIGSYDGMVGVLLDNGEYVDVPEDTVRVIGE